MRSYDTCAKSVAAFQEAVHLNSGSFPGTSRAGIELARRERSRNCFAQDILDCISALYHVVANLEKGAHWS